QETDWINAVEIDDTGKAIVKVKLRKKSDEDYKKQQEALKDDKQARLFLKVTCQGDDRKHKKVFLKPIEEDQYIHPIAFGEYFKLIAAPSYPINPWPVQETFNGKKRRLGSGYGPRNVKNRPEATKFHRGLDINFGGGYDDYGAPVISTHDGVIVEAKNTTSGSGG
ncbi:MAG: hypothetical protein AAF620_20320, partial [Bacteroidota bacterium]